MKKKLLFELNKILNQDIVDIIERYELDKCDRHPEIIYKRYYLFNEMRKNRNMPIELIGQYFNKHHATVIHGIREHEHWWGKKDEAYIKAVWPIIDQITKIDLNTNMFNVEIMTVDNDEYRIHITGSISQDIIGKFNQTMTNKEISEIFMTQ